MRVKGEGEGGRGEERTEVALVERGREPPLVHACLPLEAHLVRVKGEGEGQ